MSERNSGEVKEIKIFDILFILVKWKKTLLITIGLFVILGITIAVVVSRQYKSVARVLQPKQSNMLSGLSSLSSLMRSLPGGFSSLGKADDPYDYIAIVRSRTVNENIVSKFNLKQVYNIDNGSMEEALKILRQNTEVDWTEENTLEIRVWDYNAQRAADIVNEYVDELNRRNHELQTQEATNTRKFIEQRVSQNKNDLAKAESALQEYQEKEEMIMPVDPSSSGLSAIAELYASKVKKEIELSILKQTLGEEHSHFKTNQLELETLKNKISKFPEIGLGSLRLYREIMIQQKIMEILVPLYEQARVNENKDIPVAYVLDPGVPGERPDRPKRLLLVGISTFIGIILAFVIITWKEYMNNIKLNYPEGWEALFNRNKKNT